MLLFLITLFTTTTLGAIVFLYTRTDVATSLGWFLTPRTIAAVWSNPGLLTTGLSFSLPALLILLCHELGHYFACRRYGLASTLPHFLPVPFGLGTIGAFIRIRSPIQNRSQLLDVGAAGPIAGFAALMPFLIIGIARSKPVEIVEMDPTLPASYGLLLPGKSLVMLFLTRLFHHDMSPEMVLDLHPFALAAWLGLLATALNLLPLAQLDGGHILYAVDRRAHRRVGFLTLAVLALMAFLWPGWLFWCAIVLVMGLRHPPLVEPRSELGPRRHAVALACLVILILALMPVPVSFIPIAG